MLGVRSYSLLNMIFLFLGIDITSLKTYFLFSILVVVFMFEVRKVSDSIAFDFEIREKISEIKLLLIYLREEKEKNFLSFRDFNLIEEILDIALCYGVDLEGNNLTTKDELLLINNIVCNVVGLIATNRHDSILNKINYYFTEYART